MSDPQFARLSERYDRSIAIVIAMLLHLALALARWQPTVGVGTAPAHQGADEAFFAYFVVRDASPAGAAKTAAVDARIELSSPDSDRVEGSAETSVEVSAATGRDKGHEAAPITQATVGREVAEVRSDRTVLYIAALRDAVARQWKSMHGVEPPSGCVLVVSQRAGGIVVSSEATTCPGDSSVRRGLEAAALMAQPLPYQGFEDVFTGTTVLHFGTDS